MPEFKKPSALMLRSRCTKCFQELSPLKVRCSRCGNLDRSRVGKAIADVVLGLVGLTAIVLFAFLSVWL